MIDKRIDFRSHAIGRGFDPANLELGRNGLIQDLPTGIVLFGKPLVNGDNVWLVEILSRTILEPSYKVSLTA